MTDLLVWTGPVYTNTLANVQWKRPTRVAALPMEGASNAVFWEQLKATGDPYNALMRAVKATDVPGSLGIAGFSASHQWMSDFAGAVGERLDYLQACDSCFIGAGATSGGKKGYAAYMRLAAAGKVRMVITSNGPWDKDISYSGGTTGKYAGRQFNLSSGSKCVHLTVRDAFGGDIEEAKLDVPPGVPAPERMFRRGELYWFAYNERAFKDAHGAHANELAAPYMQLYGAPWLGGERGLSGTAPNALAMALGAAAGAAAARYVMKKAGY